MGERLERTMENVSKIAEDAKSAARAVAQAMHAQNTGTTRPCVGAGCVACLRQKRYRRWELRNLRSNGLPFVQFLVSRGGVQKRPGDGRRRVVGKRVSTRWMCSCRMLRTPSGRLCSHGGTQPLRGVRWQGIAEIQKIRTRISRNGPCFLDCPF